METTTKINHRILPALSIFFVFLSVIACAQKNERAPVKVKIVKIVDGDSSTIEKTMDESSVEDFTKQFQNIKGKNVQVMITVDGSKDKKEKKSVSSMHFNFDMDSTTAKSFSKCFAFSDSALCKKLVWNDSLMKGLPKDFNFDFHFDEEAILKDFDINTEEDGKSVIIKKQGGNTIVIHEDDDNVSISRSESNSGNKKTKTKTIVINDDKTKTKKKVIVSTSVVVIDMEDESSEKSDKRTEKEESSVNFYPNPSDGNFMLDLELSGKEDASVRITDMNGKEIYTDKISGNGRISKSINLGTSKKGTFILTVKQSKRTTSKKIIIE